MTLSRKAIVATVCLVAIYVGLDFLTRSPDGAQSDTPRWLALARKQQTAIDSITRARVPLVEGASRASAAAIVVTNNVFIDTTLPKPQLTTGTAMDTLEMGWVVRRNDTTHYAVPQFVVHDYEIIKAAWQSERTLRIYDSTYTIPYKDTLNVQLWQLTKSMGRDLEDERSRSRQEKVLAYVKGALIGGAIVCVLRCGH